MTCHRNPCGICGHFDHLEVECFFAEPGEPEIEAVEQRPQYTQSPEYAAWIEGLGPSVGEVCSDHPLKRRAA